MKKRFLAALALSATYVGSSAALEYDDDVTSFLSSGNPSSGWTTAAFSDLTLGLRARNLDNNSSANDSGEYAFSAGYSSVNTSLALWNYEFTISASQVTLDQYNFYLGIDVEPGETVNYQLSLINPIGLFGNAVGTSDGLNFIQGSLNIVNNVELGIPTQDPDAAGFYDFRLFAVAKLNPDDSNNSPLLSSGGNGFIESLPTDTASAPVADVNIRVTVTQGNSVPDAGSTWAILGLSLAGLAGLRRRFAA